MSDRSTFWPAPPDWTQARIEAPGVTLLAAQGGLGLWLLSGDRGAIQAQVQALVGVEAVLPLAPDRTLLVTGPEAALAEGWQDTGLAVSDLSQALVRIDLRGPGATALLARGSATLALDPRPRAAALGFAGLTVLFQPLDDGARLYVDHSQAPHLWHWLSAACHSAKDIP